MFQARRLGLPLFFVLSSLAGSLAGGCGPLPGDAPGDRAVRVPEVVMVRTDHPGYSYLIDTRRHLCFIADRYSGRLTRLDCEDLPEAVDLLGLDTWYDDDSPVSDPARTPEEPSEDPIAPPDYQEIEAFKRAYVAIFCAQKTASRDKDSAPPSETELVEAEGLALDRYHEIRRVLSRDAEQWRALSERSVKSCP